MKSLKEYSLQEQNLIKQASTPQKLTTTIPPHFLNFLNYYRSNIEKQKNESMVYRYMFYPQIIRMLLDLNINLFEVPGVTHYMIHQYLNEYQYCKTNKRDMINPLLSDKTKAKNPHYLLDSVYFPKYVSYVKMLSKTLYALPEYQAPEYQQEYRGLLQKWNKILQDNEETHIYVDDSVVIKQEVQVETVKIVQEIPPEFNEKFVQLEKDYAALLHTNGEVTQQNEVLKNQKAGLEEQLKIIQIEKARLEKQVTELQVQLKEPQPIPTEYRDQLRTEIIEELQDSEDVLHWEKVTLAIQTEKAKYSKELKSNQRLIQSYENLFNYIQSDLMVYGLLYHLEQRALCYLNPKTNKLRKLTLNGKSIYNNIIIILEAGKMVRIKQIKDQNKVQTHIKQINIPNDSEQIEIIDKFNQLYASTQKGKNDINTNNNSNIKINGFLK